MAMHRASALFGRLGCLGLLDLFRHGPLFHAATAAENAQSGYQHQQAHDLFAPVLMGAVQLGTGLEYASNPHHTQQRHGAHQGKERILFQQANGV